MSQRARWGRRWKIVANNGIEKRTFHNRFRAKFTRTMDTEPNECELTIINLNEDSRAFLDKEGVNIELHAGYISGIGLVFKGAVKFVDSGDSGTDHDCIVHLRDGEIQWGAITINMSFKEGTPREKVIERLFKKLTGLPKTIDEQFQKINQGAKGQADIVPTVLFPKIDPDTIEDDDDDEEDDETKYLLPNQIKKRRESLAKSRQKSESIKLERDKIYRGAAFKKLAIFEKSFNLKAVWDNQVLHIIPAGQALKNEASLITSRTGMVGSPQKQEDGSWKVLFTVDHTVNVGHLIYVDSETFKGTLLVDRIDGDLEVAGQPWYYETQGREYAVA